MIRYLIEYLNGHDMSKFRYDVADYISDAFVGAAVILLIIYLRVFVGV